MKIPLTRALVLLHRWLGVALSLFVAAWFASGIILIYVPFPSLPAAERVASRADIPLADVRVSPAAAIAALGEASLPDGLRLVARGGRPVYLLHQRNAPLAALWADDGRPAALSDAGEAAAIAAAFSKTAVRSGEVLQRTRRAKHVWNYFGAVTHWIYPSVLRRHWAAWDRLVWWLALAYLVVSISGLWLGIDRLRRAARAKTGRLLSVPTPQAEQIDRLRGLSLADAAARFDLQWMRAFPHARELGVVAFGVQAWLLGQTRRTTPTRACRNPPCA